MLILNHCPVTTFESPCGDPLLSKYPTPRLPAPRLERHVSHPCLASPSVAAGHARLTLDSTPHMPCKRRHPHPLPDLLCNPSQSRRKALLILLTWCLVAEATLPDGLQAQQAAFLQHLQTDTEDREILGAKFAADAEQYPELQVFLKPAGALRGVLKSPQPDSQTPQVPHTSFPQFPAWIKTFSGSHAPSAQAREQQASQPCLRQHGLTPQTLKELLGSDPYAADYLQPRAVATQLRGVSQQAQQAALQLRAAFGQQAEGAVQSMGAAQGQDSGPDSAVGQLRKASRYQLPSSCVSRVVEGCREVIALVTLPVLWLCPHAACSPRPAGLRNSLK